MIGYPRRVSIWVVGAYIAVLGILFISQDAKGVFIVGSIAAALFDIRLYAFMFVGLALKNRLNPLFLAILIALLFTAYLFLTLQKIWAELNIDPNFFGYWSIYLASLFLLYSLLNAAGVQFALPKKKTS